MEPRAPSQQQQQPQTYYAVQQQAYYGQGGWQIVQPAQQQRMYYTPYSGGQQMYVVGNSAYPAQMYMQYPQQAAQQAGQAGAAQPQQGYTPMGFVPLPYRAAPSAVGTDASGKLYITPINQAQAAQPQVAQQMQTHASK